MDGEWAGDGKMKSVSSKEKENFLRQRIRTTFVVWNSNQSKSEIGKKLTKERILNTAK
jgi:hypothetical protein